jgi:hypothetical protein
MRRAWAGSKRSYKQAGVCVFKLSVIRTMTSASGKSSFNQDTQLLGKVLRRTAVGDAHLTPAA